jgi:8-oxo-dGTP diphosphatase
VSAAQRAVADALARVDSGAELFRVAKPATPPKHLVSYFVVVDGDHVLLVDHKNARLWLPSGGHVEPDEHPRTTVLRELREELGFTAAHAIEAPLMITCTTTISPLGIRMFHCGTSFELTAISRSDSTKPNSTR